MAPSAYAVARVRGLEAHLLGRQRLYELAAQPALAGRLEVLRRAGLVSSSSASVEAAARDLVRGLGRDVARVDGLLEGSGARRLVRAVLAIDDAWHLKTVLRGILLGEPASRVLALVTPTAELDAAALKELVAQRTLKAAVDLLASWGSPYAPALLAAVAATRGHLEPSALELAVARVAFARAREAAARAGHAGRPVARLVAELIDLTNAVTLLELSGKAAARELFLEGGLALARRRYERLAALPPAEARAALAADRALGLAPAFVDGAADPFRVDRLVRRRPLLALRRAAREEPLSLAVPLLYLLERHEEVRAIHTLLEGTEVGLSAHELLDLVEVGS